MCWRVPLAVYVAAALTVPATAQESVSAAGQEAVATQDPAASSPDQKEDITVTGTKPDRKKKTVCRRTVTTGSIMATTTCRTVADWENTAEQSAVVVRKLQEEQRRRRYVCEIAGRC
jgi:hypothetical protein